MESAKSIVCECGCAFKRSQELKRHKKTQKHIKWALNNPIPDPEPVESEPIPTSFADVIDEQQKIDDRVNEDSISVDPVDVESLKVVKAGKCIKLKNGTLCRVKFVNKNKEHVLISLRSNKILKGLFTSNDFII